MVSVEVGWDNEATRFHKFKVGFGDLIGELKELFLSLYRLDLLDQRQISSDKKRRVIKALNTNNNTALHNLRQMVRHRSFLHGW